MVGGLPGVQFGRDARDPGLIEVSVIVDAAALEELEIAGVRFVLLPSAARVG